MCGNWFFYYYYFIIQWLNLGQEVPVKLNGSQHVENGMLCPRNNFCLDEAQTMD